MKLLFLSIALLWAVVATGQSYNWTTYNFNHALQSGEVYLDSTSSRKSCSYSIDSVVYYLSGWTSSCNVPFYYLFNGTQPTPNSSTCFYLTSAYLDSCKGVVTYRWSHYGVYSNTWYCGIQGGASVDICDTYATPTAITQPIQTNKTGTVTIYDMQGRFEKTSQVSNYTEGLNTGQLYIYNTAYSDGSVDKGKFVIE